MKKFIGKTAISLAFSVMVGLPTHACAADFKETSQTDMKSLRQLAEAIEMIRIGHVDPMPPSEFYKMALEGVVSRLDSHSRYFDAADFSHFMEGMAGEYAGIGIIVSLPQEKKQSGLYVREVAPNGPASIAGIMESDVIYAVNDVPFTREIDENIKMIKGPVGSSIKVSLLRDGKQIDLNVKRANVSTRSGDSFLVKSMKPGMPDVFFIKVRSFNGKTVKEVAKALDNSLSPSAAIVMDLRDNPGGSLEACVQLSSLFLPEGKVVVSSKGRNDSEVYSVNKTIGSDLTEMEKIVVSSKTKHPALVDAQKHPVYIMVNSGSASASEIFTAALREHKRAIVFGERTFGKGSVQTLLPLDGGGALKLTTSRYYTPNGNSIQAKGIVPDFEVKDISAEKTAMINFSVEQYMKNAPKDVSMREEDLPRHLTHEPVTPKERRKLAEKVEFDKNNSLEEIRNLPKPIIKPYERTFTYAPFDSIGEADPVTQKVLNAIENKQMEAFFKSNDGAPESDKQAINVK